MQLTVVTAVGKKEQLVVQAEQLTPAALQEAVAGVLRLPPQAGLRLVRGGQPLSDQQAVEQLKDGDSILAVVAPRLPSKAVREVAGGGGAEDAEEEDALLRLKLPPDAPHWQRSLLHMLQHRLHVPEPLLAVLAHISARAWLGLLAWMLGARAAAAYELGPVYIITTIFALMLLNLGQRREGEWSAYSLFNPGMRRLPGQMTAEDLDAQVRRGHM